MNLYNVKLMQRSLLKTTIEHFHSPETETLFDLTTKFKQQQIVAFFNKIRNRRKSWPPKKKTRFFAEKKPSRKRPPAHVQKRPRGV